MKYLGTFEELQAIVESLQILGTWEEIGSDQKQFKCNSGGILNWWNNKKGSLNFQGQPEAKNRLKEALTKQLEANGGISAVKPKQNNKVFVVYGHDETARDQLESMLRRWKLEPLILDQLPSKGQTIIEKLERYTGDVGFAVVLATPDDEGHRKDNDDEKSYRARQNVVLELGMMLKQLGRARVAVLLKETKKMERPSDIAGLIYIPFKEDLQKEAGQSLAKEMAEQGYNIAIQHL